MALIIAYFLLCSVIAFSPRRMSVKRRSSKPARKTTRSYWPDTQAKLFVNAVPEPSIILDGAGIVRHVNEPMQQVFGSIAQGDPLTMKFRDPDIIEALTRVQETGKPISTMHQLRFPTERHYLVYFSPISMSGATSQESRGSHVPKNNETKTIDFILLLMLEQTERFRLDELRSDFIANVSHELRTPIASLTGFTETLLGPAKDDAESREKFLNIMLEQGQRMTRLVNDLLSLSRVEMRSHVRPTETVDLMTVIQHTVDAMTPLANEAGLKINTHIEVDGSLEVLGEADELTQVFQNLIENACKYGADGNRIDITILEIDDSALQNASGTSFYSVEILDYGKGIPAAHLPRLTERFYRVDSEESKRKMGTGLGLAVVKHILMRHHGQLKITSEQGEGASFRVLVPKLDSAST